MTAPNITIGTPEAYPGAINLTTVTSPGGVFNYDTQGAIGTDWIQTVFSNDNRRKKQGGGQLVHAPFNDTGSALTATFQFPGTQPTFSGGVNADEWSDHTSPYGSAAIEWDIPTSQIDSGVKWLNILAPFGSRKVARFSINTSNGTYVLKANFADNSPFADGSTSRTLTLTNGTMRVYPITFNGPRSSANLVVEVRRTVASGGTGAVITQYAYIAPPTAIAQPAGFKRYLLAQRGITGGPLS